MHVVIKSNESEILVLSKNSNEYVDYILSECLILHEGTRKECNEFLETIENN